MGVEEIQTNLFLISQQQAYVNVNPQTKELYFENMELNSSLIELGIKSGDILKKINGMEATLENIQQMIPQSFQWTPDTDITMVVLRGDEEIEIAGKVGTPMFANPKLVEMEDATADQIQLRNWWLEK